MIEPWQIVLALFLDLLLGDPRCWPHVAKFTGNLSMAAERFFRRINCTGVFAGTLFWVCVVGPVLFLYFALHYSLRLKSPIGADILEALVIYQCIAAKDLWKHVRAVQKPLLSGDLPTARYALSMIVGRDTAELEETGITRAAIETTAESFNDGYVAPLFWTLILGAPGALLFRCANTLDSMVGHKTENYKTFGKFSALTDDVLAYLPARLSAIAIWPMTIIRLNTIRKEAAQHDSPNAGWPESAMAHAINCQLGGTNTYGEETIAGPVFNKNAPPATSDHLRRGLRSYAAACIHIGILISLVAFL